MFYKYLYYNIVQTRLLSPVQYVNLLSYLSLLTTPHIHVSVLISFRGHVNKKKFQKSKKTLEGGGWVKCPIGYKKKLENIFLCIISFGFGEHANVYSIINAPLCLDCLL